MSTTLETDPDSFSRDRGQLRPFTRVSTPHHAPFPRRPSFRRIALLMVAAGGAGFVVESAAGSSWEVPWATQEPAGNSADTPTVGYTVRLGPDESWFNSTLGAISSGWISAGSSNPSSGIGGGINSPHFPTNGGSLGVVGTTPDGNFGYVVNLDPGGLGAVPNPPNPVPPPRTELPVEPIAPPDLPPKVVVKFGGPDWIRLEMQIVPGRKYQLLTSINLKKWTAVDDPFTATSEVVTGEFLTDRRGQYFRLEEIL